MSDPGIYLEKLAQFAHLLRREGMVIGTRETEDACRMLLALGMEERETVKTALRTVFAKGREEQRAFDRVFDAFFVSEEQMRRRAQAQAQQQSQLDAARAQADADLQINGKPMEVTESQRETYAAMGEEARARLRRFLETYQEPASRSPELYSNFIHSVFAKFILEEQMRLEDAAVGCEEVDPDMGLVYRDISRFRDTEIPRAIAIIQSISQRINSELSAQRKHAGHSGKLDFRRTIRKGLETGGSLYRLEYRKRRRRKKHLALLCDVSGSMVQFSEFALRFIQSLNHISESSRVFLFSEEVFEADAFSLQNMDLFREYVRKSGAYGKGTDLGNALQTLCRMKPCPLNDATTLLILSDAKTIDLPRALACLRDAKHLAGRVLWLNPIPEGKWPYLKSTQVFASVCTMISCATLSALAAACKRLADG